MKKFLGLLSILLVITSGLFATKIKIVNTTGINLDNRGGTGPYDNALTIEKISNGRWVQAASRPYLKNYNEWQVDLWAAGQIKIFTHLKKQSGGYTDTYFINIDTNNKIFDYDAFKTYLIILLPDYKASFVEE